MNPLVSIDVATLTPATVFAPGGVESIISKLETEVRAIPRDISTEEGREAVKSLAYKVARSKTALDEMGKELVSGIKAQAATIDAERRIIRDRCDALKVEVRGDLDAWELAEADRVALHESALVFLAEAARFSSPPSVATLQERIESVRAACARDWQEFQARADVLAGEAGAALANMLFTAEQAERDAAELAELRRLKAEREEADRIAAQAKAQAERAAQDAEAFAASERIRAEQQAKRDQERAEQGEREKRVAVEKATKDKQRRVAAKEAAEQERQRIEAGRQAAREANKKHRAKIELAVFDGLCAVEGVNDVDANLILAALIAGKIPHISITY
jgi:colicin import membrane protein